MTTTTPLSGPVDAHRDRKPVERGHHRGHSRTLQPIGGGATASLADPITTSGRCGAGPASRLRTASMSRFAASKSAIRSSWASRRAATLTSPATTNPPRPAAPATRTSHVSTEVVVVEQTVPVRPENRAPHDALRLTVFGAGIEPAALGTPDQPAMMDLVPAQGRRPAAQDLVRSRRRCRRPATPAPSTAPAPDSTVSSMRRHSI